MKLSAIHRLRRAFDEARFALLLEVPPPHGERLREAMVGIEVEAMAEIIKRDGEAQ